MGDVHVVWDDAAVQLSCDDPAGPIQRALDQLADGVVHSQKYRCPVSPIGPLHRSGELRSSIRKFRQPGGSILVGPTKQVEGGDFLGTMMEVGTPPHIIRSKGPWSLHNRETGQFFGRVVHHPGTRPHPFIRPSVDDLQGVRITLR